MQFNSRKNISINLKSVGQNITFDYSFTRHRIFTHLRLINVIDKPRLVFSYKCILGLDVIDGTYSHLLYRTGKLHK